MSRIIKIGTRPSLLALKQVEEVQKKVPDVIFDIVKIETAGDIDKKTPLTEVENADFFSDKIEQALFFGAIDVAIHSAKDLEEDSSSELEIVAMTKTINTADVLVSRGKYTLVTLPERSSIGTSSFARRSGLLNYRSDLMVKDIRGNVDCRLDQLDNGDFDAIIVAYAALIRLGLENRVSQVIPENIIKPHSLQGRLAIQIKRDREDLKNIFKGLHEN